MARVESGGQLSRGPSGWGWSLLGRQLCDLRGAEGRAETGVVLECPVASASHLRAGSSSSTVCEEVPHLDPVESLFYHQLVSVPFSFSILNIKSCSWWGILGQL